MRLIRNSGSDRVVDELRKVLVSASVLDIASPTFSLFAFSKIRDLLERLGRCRIAFPKATGMELGLLGSDADRPFRNHLQTHFLARQCMAWVRQKVELRTTTGPLPQSALVVSHPKSAPQKVITGACPFTTDGLGLTPGNQFSLIQCADDPQEIEELSAWFKSLWGSLPAIPEAKERFLADLQELCDRQAPSLIYYWILYQLFNTLGDQIDEERIVKSATGIRNTVVWKKLFKFQRDGVIGAIDKLERHGGCIIADSVGLGKTFEALAIIKYYELRNDRVLVLCPKRLRDNWTLYKANDRRNILATDRLNYDVLNHTDLSRDGGLSGEIDLAHVNWGNYDLVVIDESHNFRNKPTHRKRESRYERLMNRIIKTGVRTRVLMLSATPVNNRLADLKNQIAFITEGNDAAFLDHGVPSIEATIRIAQAQFNRWLDLPDVGRTSASLTELLGFDYFKLLDILTIARSRKHIEKYYGTEETGKFPERLKPVNIKTDVDLMGYFPPIGRINHKIRSLNLAAFTPLRYVLPGKRAAYHEKYDTQVRDGAATFSQLDREESMVHLLRVNLLKRMESSVHAFALTLERQVNDVESMLERLKNYDAKSAVEALDITGIEVDDPAFETLLIGRKVKVLLQDVDHWRWKQELEEDRLELARLHHEAKRITPERDAKLAALQEMITDKVNHPVNPGNRKILLFTAFTDTATYLYEALAPWVRKQFQMECALVTGSGGNRCTIRRLGTELGAILAAFSPRSKERPEDLAQEGELDLLIATDCISEGQNLQDCDCLVNYDIHWNPVRIIQRFGRIDRIGSPNARIRLVNFWPNMELDEYINLEQRVSGRMVLLDISATGEENVIAFQSGDQMNDLEYRRKQLLRLQEAVIDMEDMDGGISITDLTLNDFRVDLAGFIREHPGSLEKRHPGLFAVTVARKDGDVPPGVIFCLRATEEDAQGSAGPDYPLAPHYLVHVGLDGAVQLPFTQAKQVMDRLKKACLGCDLPDVEACDRFDKATREGREMEVYRKLLAKAVGSVVGKQEERAVASLFSLGGTHALKGEFAGIDAFEVVAWLVLLPEQERAAKP
ncbi:MAG: DEAD/DEAH box helicase family protein [Magnetococcales bacterium]|nr:DEAD/DEAH box helicase family protein [Magnetococcales bacterium]